MKMFKGVNYLRYIKILIYGIIFAVVTFVLTASVDPVGNFSGTVSIALGLLVMYLEYKFNKR